MSADIRVDCHVRWAWCRGVCMAEHDGDGVGDGEVKKGGEQGARGRGSRGRGRGRGGVSRGC